MFGKAKQGASKMAAKAGPAMAQAGKKSYAAASQGAKRTAQFAKGAAATGSAMSKEMYASYSKMSVYNKTAFLNSFTQILGIMACTFVVLFPKTSQQLTNADEQGHPFPEGVDNLECNIQAPLPDGTVGTIPPGEVYKKQFKILNVQAPCVMITLLVSLLFTNIWMVSGADANATGKFIQFVQLLLGLSGIGCTASGIDMIRKMKTVDRVSAKCYKHFERYFRLFSGILVIFVIQVLVSIYILKQLSAAALAAPPAPAPAQKAPQGGQAPAA